MTTFIHERMRFCFIHVPKAGGMTVTNYFAEHNRDPVFSEFSALNETLGIHTGVSAVETALGASFSSYFSFAFYRNTYDWLYSLYRYIKRTGHHEVHDRVKNIDFRTFVFEVAHEFYRPQKPLVAPSGQCRLTRLEPFENFGVAFPEILEELGYAQTHFRSANVSKNKKSYRDIYTEDMVDRVREVYAEDIEYFGFKF